MSKQKKFPELEDDNQDQNRDKALQDDLNSETDIHKLAYNKDEDSFEIDVSADEGEEADYDHPDPYNTAVKNGGDADSDYDVDNYTAVDEYDKDAAETELDDLAMHINSGNIVAVNPIDAELSRTPEDDRDDLDEEGYPKNDG